MAWNTEKDAHLRDCFDMGMSCSEAAMSINKRFGSDYSRNAIIGRAMRKGIATAAPVEGRRVSNRSTAPKAWDIAGISKRTYYRRRNAEPKPQQPPTPRAVAETFRCVEVNPLNVTLLDLEPSMCRWPYGDGSTASPYTFCGCTKLGDFSYCGPHAALSIRQNFEERREAA